MKTTVIVNRKNIDSNYKTGTKLKVFSAKIGSVRKEGNYVAFKDSNGKVVAKLVYRPRKPLHNGAKVWIETENTITVI